ncbi:MAG: diacylglycerol kinase family protein [Clostridia bacterium]
MKHIFIINPNAGRGKGKKLIHIIEAIAKNLSLDYVIEVTTGPKDATVFAEWHIESARLAQEVIRIYAVGGDGTANEVMNGMLDSNVEFAVLPGGTGNDFARTITGDHKFSNHTLEQLIEDTIQGVPCPINSARINDRHFINISSLGIDAITNYNMNNTTKKLPWLPAKVAYVISALGTLLKDRNMDVEITMDGIVTRQRIILAAISNGRFYGGGIMPSPNAHPSDNILDVCMVAAISKLRVLSLLPKYISGKHGNEKEVSFYKVTKIKISSANTLIVNIDGESALYNEVDIALDESMIPLIVPKWSPLTLYEGK